MSITADGNNLPGNEFAACLERVLSCPLQSSAAGHFHPHDRYALDLVVTDDRSQFLCVIHSIQFGAADEGDPALHEFLMHIGIGVGCAVSRNQQLSAFIKWSLRRQQLDLAGPLAEPGDWSAGGNRRLRFTDLKPCHVGAGAAAFLMQILSLIHFIHFLFPFFFLYRFFVIFRSFPLFKRNRACGTFGQTVAETVTEILPDQFCFSIYQINGTLMAGSCAQAASIALLFIDLDDLPDHVFLPPLTFMIYFLL